MNIQPLTAQVPYKIFEVAPSERTPRKITVLAENEKGKSSLRVEEVEDDRPQFDVIMRNGSSIRVKQEELEYLGLTNQQMYIDQNSGELFGVVDTTPKFGSIATANPTGAVA